MACTFETASTKAQLAPHDTICYQITSDYLQNDSLYFRISYKDTRYDYYYYYYFTRYIVTPVVATTVTYIPFILDNAVDTNRNSDVGFRGILKKMMGAIIVDTYLYIGSFIMGNILGRMLMSVVVTLTIILTVSVWEKSRRNKPVIICWFIGSVASVLTNMYIVRATGYGIFDYLTFVN